MRNSILNQLRRMAAGVICPLGILALALYPHGSAWSQGLEPQRLRTPSNQSSLRYEINQTFDGRAFRKDHNTRAYGKEFSRISIGLMAKQNRVSIV